jgi:hypothetical protein
MNAPASITITPVRVADLLAEGERMPVYVHVIDHPDARVLVDTGMTELITMSVASDVAGSLAPAVMRLARSGARSPNSAAPANPKVPLLATEQHGR